MDRARPHAAGIRLSPSRSRISSWRSGQPLVYTLAGYAPPLGIALRADGFSAVMLVTAGLIAPAAALYARTNFATPQELRKSARRSSSGPAAGHPGGVEPRLSGRRSVQSLCRARASHLRRGSAGFSRRASGDGGCGAALSLVRAVRLGVLSARRRLALRRLWHARHRPPCRRLFVPSLRYGWRRG